jgi:spermidine synthase
MLTQILFLLFVLSGFCSLVYQIVWLRLAFRAFGIITPVLSIVVSVFMLGLALGSWVSGPIAQRWTRRTRLSPIVLYAAAEAIIGISALAVPMVFDAGASSLLQTGEIDSLSYLAYSAGVLVAALLPACIAMGSTFPLMLAFTRTAPIAQHNRFSFLYLGNVLGASLGAAAAPLVLIEAFGFRGALRFAALVNFGIAIVSLWLGRRYPYPEPNRAAQPARDVAPSAIATPVVDASSASFALAILFMTGFSSMAMEVVWTRTFTPVIGTYVYSFAGLLFVYLWATWVGSWLYRRHVAAGRVVSTARLMALLAVASLLPIVLNDARIGWHRVAVALTSIFPFCALLGYMTPRLIDESSQDDPARAGKAYAINVIGCVLGPLAAGYLLLPTLGARLSLVVLALPFAAFIAPLWRSPSLSAAWRPLTATMTTALVVVSIFLNVSYEDGPQGVQAEIRRDHTATVVSFGDGLTKQLLVNGIGITSQTPLTKLMAHMPLAFHGNAQSMAVICFGMGTTYRSALTWDVQIAAVDLARSVPEAFPYYFDDARELLKHPKGRIVVDDGRRFLHRTSERFDVITIDPPPPVEAAGSSLLYSTDFYELLKTRLKPGGIVKQWSPGGDELINSAIARSLVESFDFVVAFRSIEFHGIHFAASMSPIRVPSVDAFVSRLPAAAKVDLVEWNSGERRDLRTFVKAVLDRKVDVGALLHPDPDIVITDDRPFNEYYFLRRARARAGQALD